MPKMTIEITERQAEALRRVRAKHRLPATVTDERLARFAAGLGADILERHVKRTLGPRRNR